MLTLGGSSSSSSRISQRRRRSGGTRALAVTTAGTTTHQVSLEASHGTSTKSAKSAAGWALETSRRWAAVLLLPVRCRHRCGLAASPSRADPVVGCAAGRPAAVFALLLLPGGARQRCASDDCGIVRARGAGRVGS